MNESIELVHVLGRLHTFFNKQFFENKLPMPVITLSGEGRSRRGFYHPARWMESRPGKGKSAKPQMVELADAPDEILVHSELGLSTSFAEIGMTFVHQMVHQAQEHYPEVYGDPSESVNSANHYHNKAWHEFMRERVGLKTEGKVGAMKITPQFEALIGRFDAPTSWLVRIPSEFKAPTKLKLWMCNCTRIRCAVELKATCGKCHQKFQLKTKA